MIPYIYYFEICERSEIPEWLRSDIFLVVSWVQSFVGLRKILENDAAPTINTLAEGHSKSGEKFNVIELGCGSGDSLITLSRRVSDKVNLVATDILPQPLHWKNKFLKSKNISWKSQEVSFENFDQSLRDELKMPSVLFFNCAFHHMKSPSVREFFIKAANLKTPILIVEPLQRTLLAVFYGALGGLLAPLAVFDRRITFKRKARLFLLTWVIPIIPFINFHDGVVSALRQRRKEEWLSLTQGTNYEVEIKSGLGPFKNFQTIEIGPASI